MTDNSQFTQPGPNLEDPGPLKGDAVYTGDVPASDALHLCFLRSSFAHGRLSTIDTEAAKTRPGVVAVFTAKDLPATGNMPVNPVLPLTSPIPDFPLLADDTVSAIGQPIAAVLANRVETALDAIDDIAVAWTETEANPPRTIAANRWTAGDAEAALAKAAVVVTAHVDHALLAPSPMEPRSILVRPNADGLTIWHSTQTPHRSRSTLSQILGIAPDHMRVIASQVGGAFGMKGSIYPEEVLAVWAAQTLNRPVKWIATRSEEFLSATHGRGIASHGRLGLSADGTFLALSAQISAPLGHWVPNSGLITGWNAARVLPSGYDIPHVDISTEVTVLDAPPRGIYRGAGRPEANLLMERLIDTAARATGLDPLEIRRRNLLPAHAMPKQTATGNLLDSGDYQNALQQIEGPYRAALTRRDQERSKGRLAGVGLAFYVEPSGEGWESAQVSLMPNGTVSIASGSSAQGQSRRTAYARIAAEALDVPPRRVTVTCGDTGTCPEGIGALASRSTAIGGSAVLAACQDIARRRAEGEPLPITALSKYETQGQAWGFGVYLAEVTLDPETGQITVTSLACLDDPGTVIAPMAVDGQIQGGVAQGLGETLYEALKFDETGQLLTASFMDYAMPRAADMPPLSIHKMETPSPMNLLGAKGVGEAGTIGAPPAILNAALDALAPLGVTHLDMPLTPCSIWTAIRSAEQDRP